MGCNVNSSVKIIFSFYKTVWHNLKGVYWIIVKFVQKPIYEWTWS